MYNEYFHIRDLKEKLQLGDIPEELFSETFLLDHRKNQVKMSEGMAEVFRSPGQPPRGTCPWMKSSIPLPLPAAVSSSMI